MDIINDIVQAITGGDSFRTPTPFSQLVSRESVVNPQQIREFAESQVNPDAYRQAAQGWRSGMGQVYGKGMNRFGAGKQYGQNLLNLYERQRQEQLGQMELAQEQNMRNYYNTMQEDYYRDPNLFNLDSFRTDGQQPLAPRYDNTQRAPLPKEDNPYNPTKSIFKPLSSYY